MLFKGFRIVVLNQTWFPLQGLFSSVWKLCTTGIWWVEARDAAKHHILCRTAPQQRIILPQNVNRPLRNPPLETQSHSIASVILWGTYYYPYFISKMRPDELKELDQSHTSARTWSQSCLISNHLLRNCTKGDMSEPHWQKSSSLVTYKTSAFVMFSLCCSLEMLVPAYKAETLADRSPHILILLYCGMATLRAAC